ncbi:hypothetical protein J0H58_20320 [bacterium]|nr:hypothetical protein [bacterium]
MSAPTFLLIDLSAPGQDQCRGQFASRREAHRAALALNLRAYQVKAA